MAIVRKWRGYFSSLTCATLCLGVFLFLSVSFAFASTKNSASGTSSAPNIWSDSTSFAILGKQFQLLKRTNQRGAVIEQILISDDRMVISSDPLGTGKLDTWQLITPKRAVLMHQPRNGKFQFMEVVEKGPKAILEMKFVALKSGDYKLYAATSRPYRRQFNSINFQDYVVGCRETEKQIQDLAADVNEVMTKDSSNLKNTIKSEMMNKTCSDDKSTFKGESVDAMVDGIMKVAGSDPEWNHKKMENIKAIVGGQRSVDQKGTYLQCMRYYHLDTHASRIEAAFATYMNKVKLDWKFYWRVDCQQKAGDDLGSYDQPPGEAPVISFFKTAQDMLKKGNQSLADAYAETFFHEMIHYSLIADEDVTKDIENCCAPGGDQKACTSLATRIRNKAYGQQIENQIAAAMGDNYAAYRDILTDKYGPGANQVMDDFFTRAGSQYSILAVQSRCKPKDGQKGLSESCETEFKTKLANLADDTFGGGPNSACTKSTTRGVFARSLEAAGVSNSVGASGNKALDSMTASQADNFCGALSAFSQDLFSSAKSNKFQEKYCPNYKKKAVANGLGQMPKPSALAWLTQSLTHESSAYASGDDSIERLCAFGEMKQTFSYALSEANVASDDGGSYAPPGSNEPPKQHVDPSTSSGSGGTYTAPAANNSNKNHENIDHAEIAHGTTAGNPLPQPSSGVNVGYKNETSGPRRPDYSSIPSERERIIHKELEQQDGTFGSKLSQVAERLARTGVERANAQERENERTSGDRSGSPLTLIQIKTPDLKLPSPYEPGPEPGFNSNGRAIAYAASNQANASAAAANLSGMAYTKPGVGTGSKAPNANGKENPAVNGQPDSGKNSSVGAAAGNRGLSAVTGGIGASAAASIAAKKEKKTFDLETRARKALLVFLQGPYKRVKSELERPAVRERLMHHKIQVIDDEKQVYGPQDFKDQLIYDASPKLQRLVIVKKPAREAAGR